MNRLILVVGYVSLCLASGASALEGDAALFPEVIEVGATRLVRRGVGRMRRWMITGADVALYTEPGLVRNRLLDDVPKALAFYYYVRIRSDQFNDSGLEVLRENSPAQMLAEHQEDLATYGKLLRDVRRGDRYLLTYEPGRGTALALNGKELGLVPGASFAALYFRIWLGEPPIDARMFESLIKGM